MEPGHEDREYVHILPMYAFKEDLPQWSPVMKTGNTTVMDIWMFYSELPQWSPVMKTGNTCLTAAA